MSETRTGQRHEINLPRRVLVGSGALNEVPSILRDLGLGRRVLICTGPHTYQIAGRRVEKELAATGFETTVHVVRKPTFAAVQGTRAAIRRHQVATVVAVGGGKVIGVSKVAAFQAGIPFVSCPTTPTNDAITSMFASLKKRGRPVSIRAHPPIAIIGDTAILASAPHRHKAAGFGEIIAKYTAVLDWQLAARVRGEYYGDYAANLALMSARLVMRNTDLIAAGGEDGVRVLFEALVSCGVAICIAGSTRPASGSEHLFSHALDLLAPNSAMHGEQCGIGTIMMTYLHGRDWTRIRDALHAVRAPTTATHLHIPPPTIVEALELAARLRPTRYTILGDRGLTRKAAIRLAEATGVIPPGSVKT